MDKREAGARLDIFLTTALCFMLAGTFSGVIIALIAGTLISAILRVSNASWRTPVTRMAEFITAVALTTGALFVIFDLGRPDRLMNVLIHGRWQSPIVWDVVAVSTYLTASVFYLYLPMVPDLAFFRDRFSSSASRSPASPPIWTPSWPYNRASMSPLPTTPTVATS